MLHRVANQEFKFGNERKPHPKIECSLSFSKTMPDFAMSCWTTIPDSVQRGAAATVRSTTEKLVRIIDIDSSNIRMLA